MNTATKRAKRLLVVAAITAWIIAGVQLWRSLSAPDSGPARAVQVSLARRWHTARTPAPRTLADTYAVVLTRHSTVAWSELLHIAGVPLAVESQSLSAVSPSARLVVIDSPQDPVVFNTLGAPDRAVISIENSGPTHTARTLTWADVTVPLGRDTTVVSLTLREGETVIARDDTNSPIATLSSHNGTTLLRLGLDLADALWTLRFGDPSLSLTDRDSNHEIQPADALPALTQDSLSTPFSDRVISHLVDTLSDSLPCPLPRLRSLPTGTTSLVVITADQDYANDSKLITMAEALESHDAHATFLLTEPSVGRHADLNVHHGTSPTLSLDATNALLSLGHSVGVHPFPNTLEDITAHVTLTSHRLSVPVLIARNHHLRWFTDLGVLRAEASASVAMNLDTMVVCAGQHPCVGFPAGTAFPVMAARNNTRIAILQQPTAIDDFSLRVDDYSRLAAAAQTLATSARTIISTARTTHSPVVLNAHPTLYAFAPQWLTTVVTTSGVKAISATEWLSFVLHRRASRISASRCTDRPTVTLQPDVSLQN